MGIFKKKQSMIMAEISQQGEIEVTIKARPSEMVEGFEAICRGVLRAAKKYDEMSAAVMYKMMERAVYDAAKEEGIKDAESAINEFEAALKKALEESGEADA